MRRFDLREQDKALTSTGVEFRHASPERRIVMANREFLVPASADDIPAVSAECFASVESAILLIADLLGDRDHQDCFGDRGPTQRAKRDREAEVLERLAPALRRVLHVLPPRPRSRAGEPLPEPEPSPTLRWVERSSKRRGHDTVIRRCPHHIAVVHHGVLDPFQRRVGGIASIVDLAPLDPRPEARFELAIVAARDGEPYGRRNPSIFFSALEDAQADATRRLEAQGRNLRSRYGRKNT